MREQVFVRAFRFNPAAFMGTAAEAASGISQRVRVKDLTGKTYVQCSYDIKFSFGPRPLNSFELDDDLIYVSRRFHMSILAFFGVEKPNKLHMPRS